MDFQLKQMKLNGKAFVYDKRTWSCTAVELPSNSYDDLYHSTEIEEHKHLDRFFASEISEMEKIFGIKCGYMSITSSEDKRDINDPESDNESDYESDY